MTVDVFGEEDIVISMIKAQLSFVMEIHRFDKRPPSRVGCVKASCGWRKGNLEADEKGEGEGELRGLFQSPSG